MGTKEKNKKRFKHCKGLFIKADFNYIMHCGSGSCCVVWHKEGCFN